MILRKINDNLYKELREYFGEAFVEEYKNKIFVYDTIKINKEHKNER